VATYDDNGISGAKGRNKRLGLDAMLTDATRGRFNDEQTIASLTAFAAELEARAAALDTHSDAVAVQQAEGGGGQN
jgi:hypothetical protein